LTEVHPSAVIHPQAHVEDDVTIGPYCVIEEDTSIGGGTWLGPNVYIGRWTTIGRDNQIWNGAVIGGPPQDRKYHGEPSYLIIGHNNILREFVTVHRGSEPGSETVIGDDNYLMAYCHLGHNCRVGNYVTMANGVGVSGHVTIEDLVNIGGLTGVHQFVRIGKVAMVGGMSRLVRDVPPFMLTEGNPATVRDINAVGLRRIGVTREARMALHKACKLLFRSSMGASHAIETVRREVQPCDEVEYLLQFVAGAKEGRYGRQDQR
jgi:UDP-N-acetylglucosamine acyltransferase